MRFSILFTLFFLIPVLGNSQVFQFQDTGEVDHKLPVKMYIYDAIFKVKNIGVFEKKIRIQEPDLLDDYINVFNEFIDGIYYYLISENAHIRIRFNWNQNGLEILDNATMISRTDDDRIEILTAVYSKGENGYILFGYKDSFQDEEPMVRYIEKIEYD